MMFFLFHMAAIFKKELLLLFKNPKSRLILFMPPIMQLLILGYAATMDLNKINFAVLDHARSYASRQLIAKFAGNRIFRPQPPLASEREMAQRIDRREIRMALVIPRNFDRELQSATSRSNVEIIVDGRNSSSAGIALGYAENVIQEFNRDRLDPTRRPAGIETRAWYNPNYNMRYFMVPALLAMIALLDVMLLTALSVAREREEGTFDQLLLTPYSTGELLAAKAFASIFIGLCQLTVGLLVARLWYQVPFYSSYLLLYGIFLTFLIASVGNGLLISVCCKNLQQAMLGTFLIVVPFAMLSGMATPIESMPPVLQQITRINPLRYGMNAMHGLFLEGAGIREMLPYFGILLLLGICSMTLAYLILRKQRAI